MFVFIFLFHIASAIVVGQYLQFVCIDEYLQIRLFHRKQGCEDEDIYNHVWRCIVCTYYYYYITTVVYTPHCEELVIVTVLLVLLAYKNSSLATQCYQVERKRQLFSSTNCANLIQSTGTRILPSIWSWGHATDLLYVYI